MLLCYRVILPALLNVSHISAYKPYSGFHNVSCYYKTTYWSWPEDYMPVPQLIPLPSLKGNSCSEISKDIPIPFTRCLKLFYPLEWSCQCCYILVRLCSSVGIYLTTKPWAHLWGFWLALMIIYLPGIHLHPHRPRNLTVIGRSPLKIRWGKKRVWHGFPT